MTTTPTHRITSQSTTGSLDALPPPMPATPPDVAQRLEPGRYLALGDGPDAKLLPLTHPITHLGRGFTADVQLEDPGISRRHAILMQDETGVRILDDRSSNGTFVNGRRIAEATLHDGDAIGLGRIVLLFVDVVDATA